MTYNSGNNLVNAKLLLEKTQVHEGMHVVDFGCGRTGHIVFLAAQVIGSKGVVYAVDILKDVLESVHRRAVVEAMDNIETIWGDITCAEGVSIAPKTIDIVFCVNVLYNFENYADVLAEAGRLLKDKGRIVIVDWKTNLSGIGPEKEHLLEFKKIIAWGQKNNYLVQDDIDVGNYHRAIVLYRNI